MLGYFYLKVYINIVIFYMQEGSDASGKRRASRVMSVYAVQGGVPYRVQNSIFIKATELSSHMQRKRKGPH